MLSDFSPKEYNKGMAKANFSKVEKALEEGMLKMTSEKLWEEAGKASASVKVPEKDAILLVLNRVINELSSLSKQDPSIYDKLSIQKGALKALLEKASVLTPQDWKEVKTIREKVEQHKKELSEKLPHPSDEEIIQKERKKHVNKRLNVREKWLPLQ